MIGFHWFKISDLGVLLLSVGTWTYLFVLFSLIGEPLYSWPKELHPLWYILTLEYTIIICIPSWSRCYKVTLFLIIWILFYQWIHLLKCTRIGSSDGSICPWDRWSLLSIGHRTGSLNLWCKHRTGFVLIYWEHFNLLHLVRPWTHCFSWLFLSLILKPSFVKYLPVEPSLFLLLECGFLVILSRSNCILHCSCEYFLWVLLSLEISFMSLFISEYVIMWWNWWRIGCPLEVRVMPLTGCSLFLFLWPFILWLVGSWSNTLGSHNPLALREPTHFRGKISWGLWTTDTKFIKAIYC